MEHTCNIAGNSDMYGLGIRIGYYLQWIGILLAPWICPKEVQGLRLANTFFVAATFLAILTLIPSGSMDVVEIYITLLFTFGSSFYLLPVMLWRILVRCNVRFDPSRFPKAKPPGTVYSTLQNLLLLGVLAFQIWFWSTKVNELHSRSCVQYGFLFRKVLLGGLGLRIINLVLSSLLLLIIAVFLLFAPKPKKVAQVLKIQEGDLSKIKPYLIGLYHIYETASRLFVAITIIVATELTIRWNAIEGVNAINSAGQTIPLVLGVGTFIRVCYIGAKNINSSEHQKVHGEKVYSPFVTPWHHGPQDLTSGPSTPEPWHRVQTSYQAPQSWTLMPVAPGLSGSAPGGYDSNYSPYSPPNHSGPTNGTVRPTDWAAMPPMSGAAPGGSGR